MTKLNTIFFFLFLTHILSNNIYVIQFLVVLKKILMITINHQIINNNF